MKAVIPAAGLGTRFLPATKNQPKEMLPVVDKPAIQYVVEECVASGLTDILIITGRGKRAIEDHFDRSVELESMLEAAGAKDKLEEVRRVAKLADIHYVRQKEPKGLGHAILCAKKYIGDEPFVVLLGDDIVVSDPPCLKQLIDTHKRYGASVLAVERIPKAEVSNYGIVDPGKQIDDDLCLVRDLVEKPAPEKAPSDLGILGRYLLKPEIFQALEETPPGKNGEIQLTDALRRLAKDQAIYALTVQGKRHDVGDKLGWLKANIEIGLAREDFGDELRAYLEGLLDRSESVE